MIEAKHDKRASLLSIPSTQCARLMTSPVRVRSAAHHGKPPTAHPVARRNSPKSQVLALRGTARACAIHMLADHRACPLRWVYSSGNLSPSPAVCCGGLHCGLFTTASHLETARTPFSFLVRLPLRMSRVFRAPSPRGPPVAPCARRRWQDDTYATAADPTNECGRRSMSPTSPAGKYVLAYPWGALSLRAAATLPTLLVRLLPLRRTISSAFLPARRSPDSRVR